MSLINDALKRAKRAQQSAPRAPAPMQASPAQQRQSDFSLPLLLSLAVVLMLIGGAISFVLFRHIPVQTTTSADAVPNSGKPSAMPIVTSATVPTLLPGQSRLPKTALPALQGIFYHPDHPSAVMDGKTVRPGATVGDFQVIAISFDTVTIGNASQTYVLHLPE